MISVIYGIDAFWRVGILCDRVVISVFCIRVLVEMGSDHNSIFSGNYLDLSFFIYISFYKTFLYIYDQVIRYRYI